MTRRAILTGAKLATALGIAAMVLAPALADARGGRGGGGRGGGGGFRASGATSVSRGGGGFSGGRSSYAGSRSSGGFSGARASSRPSEGFSSRPAAANRPAAGGGAYAANRPGGGAAANRPGAGGGGQYNRGSGNRVDGSGNRVNGGNNRVNNGNINVGNNVNFDGGDWDHGWDWDDNYHPIAAGVAFGTAAAVTSAAIGSMYYSLPPSCSPYAGSYYYCGGIYYEPRYEGDKVVYVVVDQP